MFYARNTLILHSCPGFDSGLWGLQTWLTILVISSSSLLAKQPFLRHSLPLKILPHLFIDHRFPLLWISQQKFYFFFYIIRSSALRPSLNWGTDFVDLLQRMQVTARIQLQNRTLNAHMIFEVLTVVNMRIITVGDLTSCSLSHVHRRFGRNFCLHVRCGKLFYPRLNGVTSRKTVFRILHLILIWSSGLWHCKLLADYWRFGGTYYFH
jgi:hypothetical protein